MKPNFSTKFSIQWRNNNRNLYGVFASLFSTKALNPSSPDSLFQRVQIIRDPKSSVLPVLEQWVNEGRDVKKSQLQYLVRTMKDFKRFHHAFQISQWMTDRRYLPLSPCDVAIRLNLISRVKGIEHVESYFNAVSVNLKTYNVYGSLLSVYVREKSVEKAEAIMQKMKEMGLATSSFPYNILISLYTQTGDYEKIEVIVQEMDEKGIPHDKHTMRNRIVSYVAASDISGMERILTMMEKDPHFVIDWKIYSMAANGYIKVGLIEKAVLMLKKLEGVMPFHRQKLALQFLITLYTNIGMKDELYRVWNMHKGMDENMDTTYACMITSLAKLDDFEGAEKIFEEWESQSWLR